MDELPKDFDWQEYVMLNEDLANKNEEKAKSHYIKHGRQENRLYHLNPHELPPNFDAALYIKLNSDLSTLTLKQAACHYYLHGKTENRIYCLPELPYNFDWNVYFIFNEDLREQFEDTELENALLQYNIKFPEKKNLPALLSNEKFQKFYDKCAIEFAAKHYVEKGFFEKRKYCIDIPHDFIWEIYVDMNDDVKATNEADAIRHYSTVGCFQNRKYTAPKNKFRYLCNKMNNYVINLDLPNFMEEGDKEAILIDFSCRPHLEFLLRNCILKLGSDWCHTFICCENNYEHAKSMCNRISPKIKVIKMLENKQPSLSEYYKMLLSEEFWKSLRGEKVFIYQEDSMIFKSNIDEFLKYDYIAPPWPVYMNETESGVGNGAFSLRSKGIMLNILETFCIETTSFGESTKQFMLENDLTSYPEDIFFCKHLEEKKIGFLPSAKIATSFACEYTKNIESFGGQSFWYGDEKWEKRMENMYPRFSISRENTDIGKQQNWDRVIKNLTNKMFFHQDAPYHFFDIVEKWNIFYTGKKPWAGIVHSSAFIPFYIDFLNMTHMFSNLHFLKALCSCRFLICFTASQKKMIENYIHMYSCNTNIYILKHPCEIEDGIEVFNMTKYVKNPNKLLIQIGHLFRKQSSIFTVKTEKHNKLWICEKMREREEDLKKEMEVFNISLIEYEREKENVQYQDFQNYHEFLSKNIVFLDLFDFTGDTVLLDCIIRNTPVIINKIDSVVEYLGSEYPLYFENLQEVPLLLDELKIKEAHNYLKRMDKSQFRYDFFSKKLIQISCKHFF